RAADERRPDLSPARMVPRELDPELPHHPSRSYLAMQLHGQIEMTDERVALLLERGRSGRLAAHQSAGLAEDPRIADASASDGHGLDAGPFEHREDVLDVPDVARSEHQLVGMSRHQVAQELPLCGAEILLDD